ncbi:MAG: hypothetical protein IH936_12410 [Acidobacteria bacterium]|nr:hypothetical protein [Acidobacteriota bacterium]
MIRRRVLTLGLALTLGSFVASASSSVPSGVRSGFTGTTAPEPPVDRRSHELVRLGCSSGTLSRELTLFANGTIRIRDRGGPDPGIRLAELNENELEGFRARLEEIDLSETSSRTRGPSGEMLEQCLLRLELTSGQIDEYRFPRIAVLSLALGRVLAVLDDLTSLAEQRYRLSSGLPISYQPRAGDVLVKSDGSRYRIVRVTAEGAGVEIIALESPLVLYLPKDGVRGEFVAIESRRRSATGNR